MVVPVLTVEQLLVFILLQIAVATVRLVTQATTVKLLMHVQLDLMANLAQMVEPLLA